MGYVIAFAGLNYYLRRGGWDWSMCDRWEATVFSTVELAQTEIDRRHLFKFSVRIEEA